MSDESTLIDRRTIVKYGLGIGLCCAPLVAQAPIARLPQGPRAGDLLVKSGDAAQAPLTPAEVPLAAMPLSVWAMDPTSGEVRSSSRLHQIILMRLPEDAMAARTRERAAAGVLAYTAICTHTGCEVTEWVEAERALHCPCHASLFDPFDAGVVLDGPAPRSLPALPLRVADGQLVVAGPFSSLVGHEPV